MRLCRLLPLVFLLPPALGQEASWSMEPDQARLGEPTRWQLQVEHDADDTVLGAPDVFEVLGAKAMVEDGPRTARLPGAGPGRAVTSMTWTVLGLEPGESLGPQLEIELESGLAIEWQERPGLDVLPELDEGEDAPRELPAGTGWSEIAPPRARWPWVLGALLLGLLAWPCLALVRRVVGRSGPEAQSAPTEAPAARLERLLQEADGEDPRAVGYGVSGALRDATQRVTGRGEPGHALPEWFVAQDGASPTIPSELRSSLERLLDRAEDLKFGPAEGRLSQRELLSSASDLVRALDALPQAPEPQSSQPLGAQA